MGVVFSWIRGGLIAGTALSVASCAGTAPPPATGACQDFSFQVYFPLGSDRLTTPALEVIASSAARAKACHVTGMVIVDRVGAHAGDLADRRAAVISKALTANGLTPPSPELRNSDDGAGLSLLRRRVDVTFHISGSAG